MANAGLLSAGIAEDRGLLGIQGRRLYRAHLKLIIDGKRREVTLKTPGWF